MANKIVVVGSSNTDMIIQAARIPRPGETILGGDSTEAVILGSKAAGKPSNHIATTAQCSDRPLIPI